MAQARSNQRSKEACLEFLVASTGFLHLLLESRFVTDGVEQWVALKVGVAEESPSNRMLKHVQRRGFVA